MARVITTGVVLTAFFLPSPVLAKEPHLTPLLSGAIYLLPPNPTVDPIVLTKERLATEAKAAEEQKKVLAKKLKVKSTVKVEAATSGDVYGNATILYADRTNNCVAFAKAQTGINHPMGNGARGSIQGKEPKVGAIGSLKGRPHAVVVTAINPNGTVQIKESNYKKNFVTARTLPASMFLGFVYR